MHHPSPLGRRHSGQVAVGPSGTPVQDLPHIRPPPTRTAGNREHRNTRGSDVPRLLWLARPLPTPLTLGYWEMRETQEHLWFRTFPGSPVPEAPSPSSQASPQKEIQSTKLDSNIKTLAETRHPVSRSFVLGHSSRL